MPNEKRMAGDYEITCSFRVGDREIVLGEAPHSPDGQHYLVAFCESNALLISYTQCLVSDSFPELAEVFGQRIAQEAHKVLERLAAEKEVVGDDSPYTPENCLQRAGCRPVTWEDDLNGKCIVIRPDVLHRSYRTAAHQLKLVRGGFGASAHSRGSAVFCTDLYSGTSARFERADVLAIVEPEALPVWAAQKYGELTRQSQQKGKEERE